jgi:hypothetical protein
LTIEGRSHNVFVALGPRRRTVVVALGTALVASLVTSSPLRADDVLLPVPLQVELLVKVAGYDRNMAARAGDRIRVVILTKAGNDESTRVAALAEKALAEKDTIAGLPHERAVVSFSGAPALAQLCRARRIGIVYLTPGFTDAEVAAMAASLDGVDVFTAASVADYVPKGVVLGFDLVSGKPKLLVHLGQAKKQNVNLSAEVLKMVKVYE